MKFHLISQVIREELLEPNAAEPIKVIVGGLSGASVWYCQSPRGPAALRRWPSAHPPPGRLAQIHQALTIAERASLHFIPRLFVSRGSATYVDDGNRLWELMQWMPGASDYGRAPSNPRLKAAMEALARLHLVWSACFATTQASPSCMQRTRLLQDWLARQSHGCASHLSEVIARNELEGVLVTDTLEALAALGPRFLNDIKAAGDKPVPNHFVLRDIWSDHVLFTGEEVTGIIDFGAARPDEPAADVARLLGSLEPFDQKNWQLGLEYYLEINPSVDPHRVRVLDRVSTLLSAVQWLQWLLIERRTFEISTNQLIARWQKLLARLSHFNS